MAYCKRDLSKNFRIYPPITAVDKYLQDAKLLEKVPGIRHSLGMQRLTTLSKAGKHTKSIADVQQRRLHIGRQYNSIWTRKTKRGVQTPRVQAVAYAPGSIHLQVSVQHVLALALALERLHLREQYFSYVQQTLTCLRVIYDATLTALTRLICNSTPCILEWCF